MRLFIAGLIVLGLVSSADAGRRCGRSWQTYSSYNGWSHGCTATGCHQKKVSQDWRSALATVAGRVQDNQSFEASLAQIMGTIQPQGQAAYGANVTYNGLYQSSPYGVAGATGYGAAAYTGNPWADVSTLYRQHYMLAQQQNAGAAQATDAHGKLVANEALIQAQATNFNTLAQALTAAMMGPQPVPKLESLQFQVTTNAQGQPVLQAAMPTQQGGFQEAMNALSPILTNKCISCHSGETPAGKIDMSGQLSKLQLQAMADAVDSSKMPINPDGTPGERLSHEERDLFDEAARQAP